MSKNNRAKEILVENVTKLINSEQYKAALSFRQNFQHGYSFRNLFLIFSQCPEARMIAGYRKWQSIGRQVRKGERSIAILAPMLRKEEATGDSKLFGYRTVSVFDIGQTKGNEIPAMPEARKILGDNKAIRDARTAFEELADSIGLEVEYKALDGPCGVYLPQYAKILIDKHLPVAHRLKTLVHELSHAMLNHGTSDQPRHVLELEAESAAYIVCDSLGLDTSDYSFAYLAGWAEKAEEVVIAAERACKLADKMMAATTT
jgi:antirestriction protein ArdC